MIFIQKGNCVPITIVDESCRLDEKLKCVTFFANDDVHTITSNCEIGDIIRCHRFTVLKFES